MQCYMTIAAEWPGSTLTYRQPHAPAGRKARLRSAVAHDAPGDASHGDRAPHSHIAEPPMTKCCPFCQTAIAAPCRTVALALDCTRVSDFDRAILTALHASIRAGRVRDDGGGKFTKIGSGIAHAPHVADCGD
jgi:hypothetical protein